MCLAVRICTALQTSRMVALAWQKLSKGPATKLYFFTWGLHEGHRSGEAVAVGDWSQRASFPIRSNIGRYIAITMPPTTTPRKATISGSSRETSPATAVSASSS